MRVSRHSVFPNLLASAVKLDVSFAKWRTLCGFPDDFSVHFTTVYENPN